MAKAPYLETLDGFLLTMVFEPLRMAHPDHPALHLRYQHALWGSARSIFL